MSDKIIEKILLDIEQHIENGIKKPKSDKICMADVHDNGVIRGLDIARYIINQHWK